MPYGIYMGYCYYQAIFLLWGKYRILHMCREFYPKDIVSNFPILVL